VANIDRLLNRFRPEPKTQEIGIGGFSLLCRVRETTTYSAETPDSTVEDGSFVNDHIILRPLTLEIEGNVSDVHIRRSPTEEQAVLRTRAEIGNLANLYSPGFTSSQLQAVDALAVSVRDRLLRAGALIDAGQPALNLFGNFDDQSKKLRERFIEHIEEIHFGRQIISIDMPFRRYDTMVITDVSTTRNNEFESIDFTMTARQIDISGTRDVLVGPPAEGTDGQLDEPSDKGAQEGENVERSALNSIFDVFTG